MSRIEGGLSREINCSSSHLISTTCCRKKTWSLFELVGESKWHFLLYYRLLFSGRLGCRPLGSKGYLRAAEVRLKTPLLPSGGLLIPAIGG